MADIEFTKRVAVVTGAGNGLGRLYAIALAERGALVVVNDLGTGVDGVGSSRAAADIVVDEICAAGGNAVASYHSVASLEGGRAIVQDALDCYGRVDILINNAGILRHQPFTEQTQEDFDLTLGTHLAGAFYVTQAAFPHMQNNGYGRIIFTSSAVGIFGLPSGSAYGAAKGGVIGLMNAIATEGEQHGILCNAILPVAITRMAPSDFEDVPPILRDTIDVMSQMRQSDLLPDHVVPMVLYLASDHCRTNHAMYSAACGRYARIFIGLTKGWRGPATEPASPEDIERHLDDIEARDGYIIPTSAIDELKAAIATQVHRN